MIELQSELLKAIEEIATTRGMTTEECIRQAIEILEGEWYIKD
ncbi:ribbon-helix-helix protein, CopG family [Tissierella sp. MSJ-40]|uniref:Ribbon-helix-helix protein, CopG family n=1 Tax=Tissierella simiarum TaxID=2841534 RepID=A0ABS6EC93_9FIRM|nr:ribbon-helix-helix protein, CopG family [Tissierella simiarum]MBU5440389.1 ribbon-helix-helix protein, CopG family [Tissierella simiarum]